MKTLVFLLVLSALLFIGCDDNSPDLVSFDAQISQQSNSPDWIKLPADLAQGFSVETVYSTEKSIRGNNGGYLILNVSISRPDNPLGDFQLHANVNVQKNSFPQNEYRTFTVTLDPEYCVLTITPSPNTLNKQLVVDLFVEGVDVSQVNPDNFGFIFAGDNNEIMETESDILQFNVEENWFKVRNAIIIAPTDQTPIGARYGFAR
jgi:hypothetical protein